MVEQGSEQRSHGTVTSPSSSSVVIYVHLDSESSTGPHTCLLQPSISVVFRWRLTKETFVMRSCDPCMIETLRKFGPRARQYYLDMKHVYNPRERYLLSLNLGSDLSPLGTRATI
jgi:hypothetical protein